MDFYQTVESRRTIRDFTGEPVDAEAVKRIIAAGLKAPTNDHMRSWEFVVLTGAENIARVIKKIPKTFSETRVNFILKSWKLNDECQQTMYKDGIPKQYQMLYKAGCVILPLFKQDYPLLTPESLSSLNAFASIWCCIENMLLAATAEGLACALRIPFEKESEYIAETLQLPEHYILPCYLAVGHPSETAVIPKQKEYNLADKIHYNQW